MTTAPAHPPPSRICPKCQHDTGRHDAETCPECGGSLIPVCVGCGYDLAGLDRDGLCPECGAPVARSLRSDYLHRSPPTYLAMLRSGLSLILSGALIFFCALFLLICAAMYWTAGGVPRDPPAALRAFYLVSLFCTLLVLLGWWRVSTPDPASAATDETGNARKIIRATVLVQAAASGMGGAVRVMEDLAHNTGALHDSVVLAWYALTLAAWFHWIAHFFAAMHLLRHLAARVPDERLGREATQFRWFGPLLCTAGILLLGLGPLVAYVVYWSMLAKLRGHLTRILAAPTATAA